MYRLLVVTDHQDIKQTIEQIADWEKMGFRAPRIVEDTQVALERLENHRVDAIGMRVNDQEKEKMLHILKNDYPNLPIIHLSTKKEKQIAIIQQLKLFLNRINADYSNDNYTKDEMIEIERNHLIHDLLAGSIHSVEELKDQANMMRFPISMTEPCMVVEMDTPTGDEYLAGRWHYGSERLEVALRNVFSNYVNNYYFGIAVVSSTTIRMIIAAFKQEDKEYPIDQSIMDALADALESIKQYLDLHINIKSVGVVDGPRALVQAL